MAIKPIKDTVKVSKKEKESEKTPISKMGITEVSEKHEEYTLKREENGNGLYDLIKAIKPVLSDEEVEALLYGFVETKKGIILLKTENDNELSELDINYGENAFRGILAVERLAYLGLGVSKSELKGKSVSIPIKHWKVPTEIEAIGNKAYWLLYYGLQLEKCNKRINQLSSSKKEKTETKLEDLLPENDTSDKEVSKPSSSKKRGRGRPKKKGSK